MISIDEIYTENIKGLNQHIKITPTTVFYGGNAKGKSSLLDSIKLGLLGEHDEYGKQGKKLIALSGGRSSAYVKLGLSDGSNTEWSIEPYGESAKVVSRNAKGEPSLRLNLCPDEFWGKGDTARMMTLLEMCGDSSVISKDYMRDSIARVRVKGMNSLDRDVLKKYADSCAKIIKDGDISSLMKLESVIKKDKTEKFRDVRQWKSVIDAQKHSNEQETQPIDDFEAKMAELVERSKDLGKEMALVEADEKRKINILEKLANDPSEENTKRVEKLNAELKQIGTKLKEQNEILRQYKFSKVTDNNHPERLDECFVKGSAVWNGKHFVLIDRTVEWCRVDEKKHNQIIKSISQLTDDADSINILISEIESQPNTELSKDDKKFIKLANKINYEQVIAEINSRASKVSKELQELQNLKDESSMVKAREKVHQENAEKYKEASTSHDIIKKVYDVVKEVQETIVNTAVENALGIVNKATKGIVAEEIMWNGSELGRYSKEGDWISVNTFSGAEKAVTQMALGVALANKSEMKLAVLDETSRLDKKNTRQLLENLTDLVEEGTVSQFIAFCLEKPQGFDAIKIEDTYKK
tara:strand:+ start:138 stop:1889 length:1752 start_codon:yes stop_codon:yes gene_type:complete